jgi:hypothetical protein
MDAIRLKSTYDNDEVWIRDDKEELQNLADCCTRMIEKKDSSEHFYLESVSTIDQDKSSESF